VRVECLTVFVGVHELLPGLFVVDLLPGSHVDVLVAFDLRGAVTDGTLDREILPGFAVPEPHAPGLRAEIAAGDAAHPADRHADERDDFQTFHCAITGAC
jgi:hypothetical protein